MTPTEAYATASQRALEAWSRRGALERTCVLPLGKVLTGAEALSIHAADLLIHGWDLAVASDAPADIDTDLAAFALDVEERFIAPEMRGPGRPFGAARAVPDEAPVQERLLAFVGRPPQRAAR